MNTKMLMLGILLLSGLSFAGDGGPMNWMQSVEGRYSCNMVYSESLYGYAMTLGATREQDAQMQDYLYGYGSVYGMIGHLQATPNGETSMYAGAGCRPYSEDAQGFRAAMLGYNSDAAGFKGVFNTVLRAYLTAHPTERTAVLASLNTYASGYRSCVGLNPYCRQVGG